MTRVAIKVAAVYMLTTALSAFLNITSQMLFIWGYKGPNSVEISILVGTAISFPLRYFFEKRYIFQFVSGSLFREGQVFGLYTAMSVITTLIFWATEYSFHLIWGSDLMRYIGAVVGLALGSGLKYQLDKKYVFVIIKGGVAQ